VSGCGKTPTVCVIPVFSVAVKEKCCDACGDANSSFQSGFLALQADIVSLALNAVDRKTMGFTVGEL
jgi:hypothetical protein